MHTLDLVRQLEAARTPVRREELGRLVPAIAEALHADEREHLAIELALVGDARMAALVAKRRMGDGMGAVEVARAPRPPRGRAPFIASWKTIRSQSAVSAYAVLAVLLKWEQSSTDGMVAI